MPVSAGGGKRASARTRAETHEPPAKPQARSPDQAPLALAGLPARTPPALLNPQVVLRLQAGLGNRAVARMAASGAAAPKRRPARLVVRRPVAKRAPVSAKTAQRSILDKARKYLNEQQGAPPEGEKEDTDVSEFTPEPEKAAAELAQKPQEIPPAPAPPSIEGKAPPPKKETSPKVGGKAKATGPKPKGKPGPAKQVGKAPPGKVTPKPPPPLPPRYKKQPGAEYQPPAPPESVAAHDDPKFAKVVRGAKQAVKAAKVHPKGKDESAAAQGAAKPPANERQSQAQAHQADKMAAAKPKPFDEAAFVKAVEAAMAKSAPKNLNQAGEMDSRSAGMKDAIGKSVAGGKKVAAGDVKQEAARPPDLKNSEAKPVTPMKPLEIAQPGGLDASAGMPAPVPNEQIDMRAGPAKVDNEMDQAGVTEKQLAESNEPAFTDALGAKKEGERHSQEAPGQIRKAEGAILKQASQESAAKEKAAVTGAQGVIKGSTGKIAAQKQATISKDEAQRKQVADGINKIYASTKTDVEAILDGLDDKVDSLFETGEADVRQQFTKDWKDRLGAYKKKRYSGFWGKGRWVRDKFRGLPKEADKLFEQSRELYEKNMQKLVRQIGKVVSQELTKATERIARGRKEVADYVGNLKGDLKKIGAEAAAEITEKFDDLDSSVKEKFDDLAGSLAKKYEESRAAVDEEIKAAQEANKGLIDKAIDAVKGVIEAIGNLKDLILRVLAKVAEVVTDIIAHPIRFLTNFVSGVKQGITNFAENIGEHLKKGIMKWLLGAFEGMDIDMPEAFDVKSMFKLVTQVMGLTAESIKGRIAKQVGPKAMEAIESASGVIKRLVTEGPGALWEMILEKVGDFEDMVIGKIKEFIEDRIVKAGIQFLISLLNPAAAFIKACQMIYKIVTFFVEKGRQIAEFIETVIDAIADVARGNVSVVAKKIEDSLAKLVPLAIGFLASILNLGGVAEKVRSIIDKVRKPIGRAVDAIIKTAIRTTAPIWKPIVRAYQKGEKAVEKGKEKAAALAVKGKEKLVSLFKVNKRFDVAGEQHALFTVGGTEELAVASKMVRLKDHPSEAVRNANAEYEAVLKQAEQEQVSPSTRDKRVAAPLGRAFDAVKEWMAKTGAAGPGASAPNIGRIDRHGAQPVRHSKMGIPEWILESEHVVPLKIASRTFEAMEEAGIERPSADDDAQHTILIYKGAADLKTDGEAGDLKAIDEFKVTAAELVAAYRNTKKSQRKEVVGDLVRAVSNVFKAHADEAERVTVTAVEAENRANGAKRGARGSPEPVRPTKAAIAKAAALQRDDIVNQLRARMAQTLERIADKPKGQEVSDKIKDDVRSAATKPPRREKAFTLNGKQHRLISIPGAKPRLVIASTAADYAPKLEGWLTWLQKEPMPQTKDRQRRRQAEIQAGYTLLERVQQAESVWSDLNSELDEERRAALKAKYDTMEQQVLVESQEFGDRFARGDFTGKDADVTTRVPGLYESVGTGKQHANWEFKDTWMDNDRTIVTWVTDPRNRMGSITRAFDDSTGKLELVDANLENVESNIPAKVALTSKGVPLMTFLQLRQFKLWEQKHGLQFGKGNEIKAVKWSTIANVETALELYGRMQRGESRDEALAKTHSVRYAMTPLVQTGYELVPGSVRFDWGANGHEKVVKVVIDDNTSSRFDKQQELLHDYNIPLDARVPWFFDIHAKVRKRP